MSQESTSQETTSQQATSQEAAAQDAIQAEVARAPKKQIEVRRISGADLSAAIKQGWADFGAAPIYGLFFGAIYACGGALLVSLFSFLKLPWVGYPLTMGFALIVPFVAAGVYEVSRILEQKKPLTWSAVFGGVWARAGKDLGWMALVTLFTLIIWVDFALILFFIFYGMHLPDFREFLQEIFTTTNGVIFLIVGNAFGALIAAFVFSITAVSFPLLADRDIDFVTAMITSLRVVLKNPFIMGLWAVLIGLSLGVSIATGFVLLVIVLPVLGHATWHLYRRVVV
jgi:uncharacterized membrane protein